jgi:hypothetical protein
MTFGCGIRVLNAVYRPHFAVVGHVSKPNV